MTGTAARGWRLGAGGAVALPFLIGYSVAPYPSFFNQDAAILGWGIFVFAIAVQASGRLWPRSVGSKAMVAFFVVLLAACLVSSFVTHAPWTMSLSAAGVILAGLIAFLAGAHVARVGLVVTAFRSVCIALVVAGVLSALVAIAQSFFPEVTGGGLIAKLAEPGRAIGNVRQPNQLGSLLLWAIVATAYLATARCKAQGWLLAIATVMLYGLVLTASRTALLALVALCVWGFLDRSLPSRVRLGLKLAPGAYFLMWAISSVGSRLLGGEFGGLSRFEHSSVLFTSRYSVWADALTLIGLHPWMGVGFGGFNFAWMLTPFSHRPFEGFTHTHNIVLNFFVEFGVPMAVVLLGLLFFALWQSVARVATSDDLALRNVGHAALAMVGVIAIHSLLEYPLWYAYFLLPTSFLIGLLVEPAYALDNNANSPASEIPSRPLALAALALVLMSAYAYVDYSRAARAFRPAADIYQLARQVSEGRAGPLFGHYADYAAATHAANPASAMVAFDHATHNVLDPDLAIAWSRGLEGSGQDDKARYVAQRLKEFDGMDAHPFFAPCGPAAREASASAPLPYQCLAPSKPIKYEDFK